MKGNQNIPFTSSADEAKSTIEKSFEVRPVGLIKPKSFTNARPLWLPHGARGIYGGICVAQSLASAQSTVPPDFFVHSFFGQFVLSGNADRQLFYHVEVVNDGKSFGTRVVKTTQEGRTIFTAIINFARNKQLERKQIEHAEPMPQGVPIPQDGAHAKQESEQPNPYETKKVGIVNFISTQPSDKCIHHWSRSSEKISISGGTHAHLASLAYICDNYLIGTIPHVQSVWDFVKPPQTEFDVGGLDLSQGSTLHTRIPPGPTEQRMAQKEHLRIGMMVTLSHVMYFHAPEAVKADEWMLSELKSHWAKDGRGLATQKIWSKSGILLATCIQEGVLRLSDPSHGSGKKLESRL